MKAIASLALSCLVFFSSLTLAADKTEKADTSDPPIKLLRGKHFNKTPAEAVKAMTMADGFKVTLFAAEPDIRQPNAFCIDDRGRLWVGENYTYTKYGWKPDHRDRILIFEDTDGDGKFDKRKVFTDKITYVSGLQVGHGGVWVGAVRNLLFIPDRDGDDVPDGEAEIVLDGWGRQDQHETLNSFSWGPDGWLYGCHGVFTYSNVGKPGTPKKDRTPLNAGVWRLHPVTRKFEVFAWGTSNPWGIDWDENGQLFMTACVIPHLWHMVQGGRYHRQGGQHFNRHIYDDIKTIAKHNHQGFKGRKGGFAHGGAMLYQGDSFPERFRGKLWMFNIHHRNIYVDRLDRKGSGFTGDHFDEPFFANDDWFIGFSLQYGPNGSVYFIDWYDSQICHGQTPEGKHTGRIYRLSYKGTKHRQVDVAKQSDAELVALHTHKNEWFVRHARRILHERAAAGRDMGAANAALRKLFDEQDSSAGKLRALWTLHGTGGLSKQGLLKLCDHREEYVRAWAVQLLLEDKKAPNEVVKKLAELAKDDPSPVVRLYVASALQRMPLEDRWAIAEGLVSHAEDAKDHNLPKLIWYGIEPLVPADKVRAIKLAAKTKLPLVRKNIARRAASK